uniref:ATP synthase complex subunit 8 n=1 Tax=Histeroidea sp. 5 KM-2017 TaxID=2219438 RepID=A0A346RGU5_9COLE|nr:ATP synthase F0 subunit 8 [Histeroidea sp. 5 KM-2017]
MPQMAPLSWVILFIYFTLIFICLNINNYTTFLYPSNKSTSIYSLTSKNWKW